MTGPIRFCALLLAVFVLAAWSGPAAAADPPPGPEAKIWRDVQRLLSQGKEMEACRRAVALGKYAETPTYQQAEQALMAQGISLENPLGSCTVKRIIALQNACEAERAKKDLVPDPGPRAEYLDAWGRPIRVEIVARRGFLYAVRSAGADGIWLSDDDLVVGVREDQGTMPAAKVKDPGRDRTNFLRGGSMSPPPPSKKATPRQSGEVEVNLDDLLKK